MEKKQRLIGLDLFRGIAAYAVVILHADEGLTVQSGIWSAILNFSAFAVPFFLATSFYLTISKLYTSGGSYAWWSRLPRLLLPYGFWSLLYLCHKVLKYVIKHEPDKIRELLQDPLGLIFLGKAAFHLYFIPLLLAGTVFVIVAEYLIRKRVKLGALLGGLILSLLIYECYRAFLYGVAPDQANLDTAAQGIRSLTSPKEHGNAFIRLLLVELGYMARCLPYIAVALLLNHPSIRGRLLKFDTKDTAVLLAAFLILNAFSVPLLPQTVHELARGYSALLLAVALSTNLKANVIIASLGNCSFGIYLMHLLVLEVCSSLAQKMDLFTGQIAVLTLLAATTLSFSISWVVTSVLMKQKPVAKLMFGV